MRHVIYDTPQDTIHACTCTTERKWGLTGDDVDEAVLVLVILTLAVLPRMLSAFREFLQQHTP